MMSLDISGDLKDCEVYVEALELPGGDWKSGGNSNAKWRAGG